MTNEGVATEAQPILLVEDNRDHAELIMRSFGEHRVPNKMIHISDGQQALDYLYRRGDYSDPRNSPRPRLVLLDLRLPKIDGLEVLKEIKTDEALRAIPIVILTTSGSERDVATAYAHHANSYVVKPVDFEQFTRLMSDLGYYWLGWNHCKAPPMEGTEGTKYPNP